MCVFCFWVVWILSSFQIDGLLTSSPTGNLFILLFLLLCRSLFSLLFHGFLMSYPIIIPKINVKEIFFSLFSWSSSFTVSGLICKSLIHFCVKLLQSCSILCDPIDWSPPGFSVHGILQARKLEWVAMPSSKESSQPRELPNSREEDQTLLCLLHWQAVSLSLVPPGKPLNSL